VIMLRGGKFASGVSGFDWVSGRMETAEHELCENA
jgi:hypothetical protein